MLTLAGWARHENIFAVFIFFNCGHHRLSFYCRRAVSFALRETVTQSPFYQLERNTRASMGQRVKIKIGWNFNFNQSTVNYPFKIWRQPPVMTCLVLPTFIKKKITEARLCSSLLAVIFNWSVLSRFFWDAKLAYERCARTTSPCLTLLSWPAPNL